ncbi:MAG: UDP-N-acetylmuramate--L-alanine ligase [Chitinophagales bacterium]
MNFKNIHSIYFIGIGGIGMSALARHFNQNGFKVSGYDKTATSLTKQLEREGMSITYVDSIETLQKNVDLIIYTPAIPKDHLQFNFYKNGDYNLHKRAAVLGWITNNRKGLAVAGSHGKTSTSAILNHILQTANYKCASFLGGISLNYNTNYIKGDEYCIAEADEFDRSFHQLHPMGAIITSVDTDHLDVYGNYDSIKEAFKQFAAQVKDTLVYNISVPREVINPDIPTISYGLDNTADFYPSKIEVKDGRYHYDVTHPDGVIEGIVLQGGGRHNVENTIGAMALAHSIGVDAATIKEAISTYKGVHRRFEIHIERDDFVYIDDYAHHPREIEVTLETARELYQGKKLTVVFQPHLFSRTNDLKEGLAKSLNMADEVFLMDIYPAREKPIEGVTSGVIYSLLTNSKHLVPKNQVITELLEDKLELLLTIGAGDIDTLVKPIIENYN